MLIGLTGSAGCGKSTALGVFGSLGWRTLDADALCHEIYSEAGSAFAQKVEARWGRSAIDGAGRPDRKAIAALAFREKSELEWLGATLHPEIQRRALASYEASGGKATIFDVPLLFESAWQGLFKAVICVWCEASIQRSRLLERGWDSARIEACLAAQMPSDKKLELADYGLVNNSSLEALKLQCETLSQTILNSHSNN